MSSAGGAGNDSGALSQYSVLMVDDEDYILQALKRVFRREGFRFLCAGSGSEGLRLLAETPGVAVIISDQRMPQMDGSTFLALSREIAPDANRMLLTGHSDMDATVAAMNQGGVTRYIRKPWEDTELLQTVRDSVRQYHLVVENRSQRGIIDRQNEELTRRVELEVARNREKDRLLAQQVRLAAMGEMVGAIAHQWRQPLTAASALVQNLRAAAQVGKLTPQLLDNLVDGAMGQFRYMSETIDELQAFFRPDKQMVPFDLQESIDQAVKIFQPQLSSRGITVQSSRSASETFLVNGVPNEFKQVIVNLLSNACTAIETRAAREGTAAPAGNIRVELDTLPGKAEMRLTDNGCGIAEELREKVFEPYFTTRAEQGGTGIGLYLSKMLIETSMGGELYHEAVSGETCFVIRLPGGFFWRE